MKFADHLRSWDAAALRALLLARPDLLGAVDDGYDAVAKRASNALSIGRCLIRSDVAMLVVADALVIANPATPDEIDELLGTDDVDGVVAALERLAAAGLVVIAEGLATPVGDLGDLLHRPLGLGPSIVDLWRHLPPEIADRLADELGVDGANRPSITARAVARRLADPRYLDGLLADPPEGAVDLLDALVAQRSPVVRLPAGYRYRADPSAARDRDAVSWLLTRGLLVAVNEGVAELPREVARARIPRGLAPGAALRPIDVRPVAGLGPDVVAGTAADGAGRFLATAETLLRLAEDGQVTLRRAGGVGVRELRRLAKTVGAEPRDVGRVIELLVEARLAVPAAGQVRPRPLAESWWELPRSGRWSVLVRAWVDSQTFLSRALSEGDDGQLAPALGDDEPLADGRAARALVLDAAATVEDGDAYDPEQLGEAVVWRSPNLWGAGDPPPELLVAWTLHEAALLGLAAHDAPTAALRALAAGDHAGFDVEARRLLGEDQGQIVIQSDLSALSLGPLDPRIGAKLADLADRDPGAGPTAHRFTEASLRRAFDKGWDAAAIEEFLATVTLSGVPQPLEYLIADVERRYGSIRVHSAASVIVTDDEAGAVAIASTAMASRLGLRLIAPTVIVGPVDPLRMLDELRAEGLFPVLDGGPIRVSGGPTPARAGDAERLLAGSGATGTVPADWTGPPLPEAALPGEVDDAVEALLAEAGDDEPTGEAPTPGGRGLGDTIDRLWNRPVIVNHLRAGELVEVRGVVVGAGDVLTLLNDSGVSELPLDSIISVEDPTR